MKVIPHSEYERVLVATRRLFDSGSAVRLSTTVFRAANPRYSDLPHLINGEGSKIMGSRWNAPGTMRVLHATDSPESALSEVLATYRHYGMPLPSNLHIVVRAIHVEAHSFLDLREGDVRQAIGVSEDRLLSARWEQENTGGREAISQAVGRAAAEAGFSGLIARSAAVRHANNTVVFVDRLGLKGRIVVEDAE